VVPGAVVDLVLTTNLTTNLLGRALPGGRGLPERAGPLRGRGG
jgi:hypothetical protein